MPYSGQNAFLLATRDPRTHDQFAARGQTGQELGTEIESPVALCHTVAGVDLLSIRFD
jgi:hypothetical protein